MSDSTPTIRQTAWITIIPHLMIMGLFVLVWYQFFPDVAFLLGALTYLILSFCLRMFIPTDQRKGMKNVRMGNYEAAMQDFEQSYDFFDRNEWLDKYRYITMLSSSKMAYKEMALVNIAFCYSQLGNGEKAREYYERTLTEYPANGMATAALKMLDSVKSE